MAHGPPVSLGRMGWCCRNTLAPGHFHEAFIGPDAFRHLRAFLPQLRRNISGTRLLPGLTIATGLSGHGFGIGPGIGRVVADPVAGRAPGHDLTRFRLSRFTDGPPIEIGPAL